MIEKFSWNITDSLGQPVTGVNPTIRIRALESGLTLDWSDMTFKSSSWIELTKNLVEVGSIYPGLYEIEIDLSTFQDGQYQFFAESGFYKSLTQTGVSGGKISQETGLTTLQSKMIAEMYELTGLDPTKPLTVTKTSRTAGDISQEIQSSTNITKVTRLT